MNKIQLEELVDSLFENINGYVISKIGQNKLPEYNLAYEYGEATFDSFYEMVEKAYPKSDEIFYDLGSGLGKKVLIALLGFPFKEAIGIEVIEELHKTGGWVIDNPDLTKLLNAQEKKLQLIHGDILTADITDGDVFYISIAPRILDEFLHDELLKKLETTKVGTRIITSNIQIPSDSFRVIDEQRSMYTGGEGVMYLHVKEK